MTSHRFGIGEGVTYSERRFPTGIWIAELIVVEQLSRDGAPGYRLLAQDGATEYVLGEHELSPSSEKRNHHVGAGSTLSTDLLSCSRDGGVEATPETFFAPCP